MLDSFEKMQKELKLSDSFMNSVRKAGYTRPTPVQMQAMPILFEKRDAIFLAETGSGKSLAFIAPLLHMHTKGDGIKAIIVAPTRELSIQLYKEFLMFSQLNGGGASSKNNQAHSKKQDATVTQPDQQQRSGTARVKILRKALTPRTQE